MRNVSMIMLVVAAVLGAFAVVGVRALLLSSSQQAEQIRAQQRPTVASSIVVANTVMEFGAEITPDMLREIPWAAADRPPGTFQSIGDVLVGDTRVVLRSIAPGQLVLAGLISGSGERAALSQFISEGMRAVSIRVNEISGAAGFILPGDYVDVLLTVNAGRDPREAASYVILQNILVLAIDQIADERQGGAVVARVATLEVGIEDGQRIVLASSVGEISLALRDVNAAAQGVGTPLRTIRFTDLEPNQTFQDLSEGLASRNPGYTMMVVTRELESSNQRVIRDQTIDPLRSNLAARIDGAP